MRFLKPFFWVLGALGLGVGAVGLAYLIWPLAVFNLLMPKDPAQVIMRDIAYGQHQRQRYDLFAPLQGHHFPLLIFVHGGAWDSGGKDGYDFVGHAFASKGYLTALIDYRQVPDVQYPAFVEDTAKAVAHMRSEATKYDGDPSRVYLVGHSAGAYNIVQATLNPAFAADIGSIKAIAAMAGPFDFVPIQHPSIEKAFGKYQPLEDTQPRKFIRADQPPLLMLHGLDDDLVLPESYRDFYKAVKDSGAHVEFHEYPATNHISILGDLSRPFRHRSPTYETIIKFFEQFP